MLDKAGKEANSGNKDIVNGVRHIENVFLNAAEVSAQEAVYLVLQMPLKRSSRDFCRKAMTNLKNYLRNVLICNQIMFSNAMEEDLKS